MMRLAVRTEMTVPAIHIYILYENWKYILSLAALQNCKWLHDITITSIFVSALIQSTHPLQMNPARTELLWAGSKHNISLLGSHAPVLHLRSDTVTASDHVRVLGVTFSSDLSLEKQDVFS